MKKISKLLMFAVLALGLSFAACNNEDVPNGPDQKEGNTHVSVTLKLNKGGTRAAADEDYNYIGDWAGKDKINTVSVYLIDDAAVARHNFSVGASGTYDYAIDQSTGEVILRPRESAAIKTTAGAKTVYVVVNENSAVQTALSTTVATDFVTAYEATAKGLANSGTSTTVSTSASKLADVVSNEDVIVMTNVAPSNLTVQPNITASQAIGDLSPNQAHVTVERTVARVLVTLDTSFKSEIKNLSDEKIGTISDVTWVLAQGENSLYIKRKDTWETPNFGWVPGTTGNNYITQAGEKYDYSGLFENQGTGFGGIVLTPGANPNTPADKPGNVGGESVGAGRFILPTTHKYDADGEFYKKGNTAYVLVRAKFTPTTIEANGTLTDGTFYLGGNGKFYASAADAVDPVKGVPGQSVAKYVGGKVLYYAWVNPDNVDTGKWYNSPVLRNNIYHIHITGFGSLGTNWNPLFPEDPDNPKGEPVDPTDPTSPKKPLNPDPKPIVPGVEEPTNPIDPEDPLTTPETWMSVKVNVLPWKVHSYGIEL